MADDTFRPPRGFTATPASSSPSPRPTKAKASTCSSAPSPATPKCTVPRSRGYSSSAACVRGARPWYRAHPLQRGLLLGNRDQLAGRRRRGGPLAPCLPV